MTRTKPDPRLTFALIAATVALTVAVVVFLAAQL